MPSAVLVWVRCKQNRDELASLAAADRDALTDGTLACPSCGLRCRPELDATSVNADTDVLVRRDGVWQRALIRVKRLAIRE